jgi:hypothetical protein
VTPAETAVIAAAREHVARSGQCRPDRLLAALDVLDTERQNDGRMMTWGEVITEDEVFSSKTGKWYEIISTSRRGDRVALMIKGQKKIVTPQASDPVKVRRGPSGQAADTIHVIMSGPRYTPVGEDTLKPESEEA